MKNKLAKLKYLPNKFEIIEPGDHVICAVSKQKIYLQNLNYWNVELQEAYFSYKEAQLKREDPHLRTILLFVIQREDECTFQPSRLDPTYLEAVRNAVLDGVELKTLQIVWKKNKAHFLRNDLPINLYD